MQTDIVGQAGCDTTDLGSLYVYIRAVISKRNMTHFGRRAHDNDVCVISQICQETFFVAHPEIVGECRHRHDDGCPHNHAACFTWTS